MLQMSCDTNLQPAGIIIYGVAPNEKGHPRYASDGPYQSKFGYL